jgi:hypothetical protein
VRPTKLHRDQRPARGLTGESGSFSLNGRGV